MTKIPQLNRATWLRALDAFYVGHPAPAYAMYSSLTDGISTDPALMNVPVDDHLVHRGDGVFETLKCVQHGIYNLDAHLERLARSAVGIGLVCPWDPGQLKSLVVATARAAQRPDLLIRLLLARGPGSLGVNPYDCPTPQCYVVAGPLTAPFMQRNPQGAHIGFSQIPPKPPPLANIKHCNYLPNALMAKEARDRGLDFVIGRDTDGALLEGPTENLAIVDADNHLVFFESTALLMGTTLERVRELATTLVADGHLQGIHCDTITGERLRAAREAWIAGTSHDLVAVTRVEGQPIGTGTPGPVYQKLSATLVDDVAHNACLRTMTA